MLVFNYNRNDYIGVSGDEDGVLGGAGGYRQVGLFAVCELKSTLSNLRGRDSSLCTGGVEAGPGRPPVTWAVTRPGYACERAGITMDSRERHADCVSSGLSTEHTSTLGAGRRGLRCLPETPTPADPLPPLPAWTDRGSLLFLFLPLAHEPFSLAHVEESRSEKFPVPRA